MSLDLAFERALAPVLKELTNVKEELHSLKERISLQENGLSRPIYDADALQELGYSYRESYAILRSHGHKRNGRLRVTDMSLRRYQTGQEPEVNPAPPSDYSYDPSVQPMANAAKKTARSS